MALGGDCRRSAEARHRLSKQSMGKTAIEKAVSPRSTSWQCCAAQHMQSRMLTLVRRWGRCRTAFRAFFSRAHCCPPLPIAGGRWKKEHRLRDCDERQAKGCEGAHDETWPSWSSCHQLPHLSTYRRLKAHGLARLPARLGLLAREQRRCTYW